jgi:hypothetical protein
VSDSSVSRCNDQLGGEKPRDLIGTNRVGQLRELARAIKIGMFV